MSFPHTPLEEWALLAWLIVTMGLMLGSFVLGAAYLLTADDAEEVAEVAELLAEVHE